MLPISMDIKEFYVAPAILVVELKSEGVICQSGDLDVVYGEEDL